MKLAGTCEFRDTEDGILEHLMEKLSSMYLRRKDLQEKVLILDKVLQFGRTVDAVDRQTKAIDGSIM